MHRLRYLGLLLPHLALLGTWDLAANLGAALLWFVLAVLALVWATRWRPAPSLAAILLVAAALRLLLLPLPATLSNDVYRYVWDGKVAGSGWNPYELAPDAPELSGLRDANFERLDHRDVATVYPPLALTLFSLAARFPWPVLVWKVMLILADLVGCLFLYRIAKERGAGSGAVLWYAWNPLATLETAGMGHVDAVGICWVIVAVWALAARRDSVTVALAAAAGVLTKLIPLVAIPAWIRQGKRPVRFAVSFALAVGFAFAPVLVSTGQVPSGYLRFGVSWEFNGPLYEPLWRGLERAGSKARVEAALDEQKVRSGDHEFWNRFYPWNYPRMHARLVLVAVLAVLLTVAWTRAGPVAATGLALEATLLCSATVYPWYLLWLLPFAALERRVSWLVLCCSGALAYLPQFTQAPLMPWTFLALWLPYGVLRLREVQWSAA